MFYRLPLADCAFRWRQPLRIRLFSFLDVTMQPLQHQLQLLHLPQTGQQKLIMLLAGESSAGISGLWRSEKVAIVIKCVKAF